MLQAPLCLLILSIIINIHFLLQTFNKKTFGNSLAVVCQKMSAPK